MFKAKFLPSEFLYSAKTPTTPPPENSFFWKAFQVNVGSANQALATEYIQGIKNGNLSPTQYGALMILDAYYCYMGAESFQIAYINAKEPDLAEILKKQYEGYKKYNEVFLKTWHILNYDSVIPTDTIKNYAFHERVVANYENPIYTLVVMLPCYWLWYWLSDQLFPYRYKNLYGFWIEGNHYPESAYFIGNFIDEWQKQGKEFDEAKAIQMYSISMHYEVDNFNEACSQNLLEEFFRWQVRR